MFELFLDVNRLCGRVSSVRCGVMAAQPAFQSQEARPGRDHHLAGLLFLRVARVGFRPRNALNAPDALNGDTVSFARLGFKSPLRNMLGALIGVA